MKKKQKKLLDKYYISEAFDKNRNISFNFKKANKKISGNFAEFTDALAEYVRVSEQSENETRVWFHRDAAYRGSVGLEKARLIIEHVKEKNVENQDAISYIEKENLVEKSTKKPSKKMMLMKELEEEANEITFDVPDKESKMSTDVMKDDVEYESKFDVTILDLKPYEGKLDVYYNLSSDGQMSETMMKTVEGFATEKTMMEEDHMMSDDSMMMEEEPMMKENDMMSQESNMDKEEDHMMSDDDSMMKDDMMMTKEEHIHHYHQRRYNQKNTGIKVALSLLIIIALVNLILIILNVTNVI
ncbi:hypothetical protein DA803_01515 [[Mycoplasma] phocae]|uniref:Uncharacterized protein n=1 Tax=[Mycoplasma] phocae TaxID=142651 RepID=A0A2Z5IPU0_9BACT|nr:hypothetical protein [[Mycoplasma] phocae]AXE60763.1 hypothetical protein DA803_01515 [[Mycoplasma] phocae]